MPSRQVPGEVSQVPGLLQDMPSQGSAEGQLGEDVESDMQAGRKGLPQESALLPVALLPSPSATECQAIKGEAHQRPEHFETELY